MKTHRIKNKAKSRKGLRSTIIVIEAVIMIIAILATTLYVTYGQFDVSNIDLSRVEVNDIDNEVFTGYTTIALFGLDSRDENVEQGNSDTIILCVINNETSEIKMASVYRDTYLAIGNTNNRFYNKCNSAYGYYGVEGALTMLNTNLDLNVTQYVTTDWAAMVKAIDLMGGLDLEMTSEEVFWMNGYQVETAKSCGMLKEAFDLPLKNGVQHCNGVQATAFCRIRYTKGDDFKRTERQRYVLEQMFAKAKTLSVKKLSKIAQEVFPMISTSLTFKDAIKLGTRILDFKLGETYGFPYNKRTGTAGQCGSCVFTTDLVGDVEQLHNDLYNDSSYQASSTVQSIAGVANYAAAVTSGE